MGLSAETGPRQGVDQEVLDWLLDGDPAIRWQTMRDLQPDTPSATIARERSRVATDGWGARILALQGADGSWAGGACFPQGEHAHNLGEGQPWIATLFSLALLQAFGIDPSTPAVRSALQQVHDNVNWEHGDEAYFDGEVEECINGRTLSQGAYFGFAVDDIVERLLAGQLTDDGWNCEPVEESRRSSFHSTINVLEGLLSYERSGGRLDVADARRRAEDYFLDRRLMRRLSTGEIVDASFLLASFPTYWYYDVLRGLEYFRAADRRDPRLAEAIDLIGRLRSPDGRWPLQNTHPGTVHFPLEDGDGRPSRWNTLRSLRVLDWYAG